MSQSLQSIHSLSMQLNRASSMQEHLNELCRSSMDLSCSQRQASGFAEPLGSTTDARMVGSGRKLSRLLSKKAKRVKETLLKGLGKSTGTKDELFQVYEKNFYKQQAMAVKLEKEFKNHLLSSKLACGTAKSLYRCIQKSTGEYQSARHDLVCENLAQMEHLNEDLLEKLRVQVLAGLSLYLSQFNEMRDKIMKRHRKLIDYDISKRQYELMLASVNKKRALQSQTAHHQPASEQQQQMSGSVKNSMIQTATSKLIEEARLLKLREQYNYSRLMFETLNSELHEQLPAVYERRMKNLLMALQSYFALEAQFHADSSKLFATASDVVDELPTSGFPGVCTKQKQAQLRRELGYGTAADDDDDAHDADDDDDDDGAESRGEPDDYEPADEGAANGPLMSRAKLADAKAGAMRGRASAEMNSDSEDCSLAKLAGGGGGGCSSSGFGSSRTDSSLESACESIEDSLQMEATVGCSSEPQSDGQLPDGAASCSRDSSSPELEAARAELKATGAHHDDGQDDEGDSEDDHRDDIEDEELRLSVTEKPEDIQAPEVGQAASVEAGEASSSGAQHPVPADSEQHSSSGLASGPLYKVKSDYKYLAEDVDELCFEAEEVIQVLAAEPGQEVEEGWLVGVREVNGQRGLFPANYTHQIDD